MKKYDKRYYKENAVVTYIMNKDSLLLINKKRGLGAGKVNVPGGHIEDGETPFEAAYRESLEEVSLKVEDLVLVGKLYFKFLDGLTMMGWVFKTDNYTGEPKESDEADPFWCNTATIPFNNMWADDIVWIPEMLKGRFFRGYFEFDEDIMLKRVVEFYDSYEEFI